MRTSYRSPVRKSKSTRRFNRQASRTKAANVAPPMRGGWRL